MRLVEGGGPAFRFNFCVVSIGSFAIWLSILWLSILYYEFDGEAVVFSGLSIFSVGCLWAIVVPFGLGGLLHIALRILGAGRYRYANTAKVALYLNGIMLAYGGLLQFIPVPLLTSVDFSIALWRLIWSLVECSALNDRPQGGECLPDYCLDQLGFCDRLVCRSFRGLHRGLNVDTSGQASKGQ